MHEAWADFSVERWSHMAIDLTWPTTCGRVPRDSESLTCDQRDQCPLDPGAINMSSKEIDDVGPRELTVGRRRLEDGVGDRVAEGVTEDPAR
jgi:hypothetical protein